MMLSPWSWRPVCLGAGETYHHSFQEAENLFRADGLALEVTPAACSRSLRVTLLPLQNGRPEFIEKAVAEVLIPAGCDVVEIPFALIDNRQRVRAHLKYVGAVELCVMEGSEPVELLAAGPLHTGDLLVSCGIQAIWNFASVRLEVPENIVVQNENLAASATTLRLQLK